MQTGQLTSLNLILKLLVESKPLDIVEFKDTPSLLKEKSLPLHLSVTSTTLFVLLAEELTFAYLRPIQNFATETLTFLWLSKCFVRTDQLATYLRDKQLFECLVVSEE